MKIGFVTCVELGLACMEAIYEAGGRLDLAVSLLDDIAVAKSGRVYLDDFCERHDVELLKVRHVNDARATQRFRQLDWLFIIGWSQIASSEVIDAPRLGTLGMHPTLLPRGRGRASIPWAILKRLEQTGVTLFKLDNGVDTGPIVAQKVIPLDASINATDLYERVKVAHYELLRECWPSLLANEAEFIEQDESKASIWPGRRPQDGEINLSGSAADAECLVRAVTRPYPGAYFKRDGRKIIVWDSAISPAEPDGDCLEFFDGYLALLETEEMEL